MRKSGLSYREIRNRLKVPQSTLSDWFRDEKWSREVELKLREQSKAVSTIRIIELNRVRGINLNKAYKYARDEARKEFEGLKFNPLFIAGLMLYWGEGSKAPKRHVQLANSDAAMVRLYVFFLRNICKIPLGKIKAHLLIYPDHEEMVTKAYWVKIIGIPRENFTKSVVIQGRHLTRRLGWGVCTVTVSSVYFKQKILEWTKLLATELMNREYYENIAVERT